MDVVEFLEARLAEDELGAQDEIGVVAATYGKSVGEFEIRYEWARFTTHAANGASGASFVPGVPDPSRVLREVASKRAIIEKLKEGNLRKFSGLWEAIELLALPYSDHPDYEEEWRP